MRIVIISDWFSEGMGYIENCLPKAMAALGHEVHVVTSNGQVYFDSPYYRETYEAFLGPAIVPCEVKTIDGYTLHRIPYEKRFGRIRIKGLDKKICSLQPQIVQTFDVISLTTYEAAFAKLRLNYKLFTGNHIVASVSPPATRLAQHIKRLLIMALPGRLISFLTEKCYAVTPDAVEIAVHSFGTQPQKVKLAPLGVETDLFYPVGDELSRKMREQLREQLGFAPSDIVCIYTGRFTKEKNPLCLAQAISELTNKGEPFRGLFVGNGEQEAQIRDCPGCVVLPLVPFWNLPPYYRAADLGVWPRQESTSMLDATACGIPIVTNDRVKIAIKHVQEHGVTYKENSVEDLQRALLCLRDIQVRNQLGSLGATKMSSEYSWLALAKNRLNEYELALQA